MNEKHNKIKDFEKQRIKKLFCICMNTLPMLAHLFMIDVSRKEIGTRYERPLKMYYRT
jgi:hypothetical protein